MACSENTGLPYVCDSESGLGGIRRIIIGDMNDITITPAPSTWIATAEMAVGTQAFEYSVLRGNASHVTSPNVDVVAGSTYFTHTMTIPFVKREANKSKAVKILGEGQRYLFCVYKDENEIWWIVEDLQLTGGDETSGVAKADNSKYEVILTGETRQRAYTIAEADALALLEVGV